MSPRMLSVYWGAELGERVAGGEFSRRATGLGSTPTARAQVKPLLFRESGADNPEDRNPAQSVSAGRGMLHEFGRRTLFDHDLRKPTANYVFLVHSIELV